MGQSPQHEPPSTIAATLARETAHFAGGRAAFARATADDEVLLARVCDWDARKAEARVALGGVSPMQAIRGATYWPAVAMKVEKDVGTVTPGKYADIIAVKGDVLRHIALLQRVDLVVRRGIRHK